MKRRYVVFLMILAVVLTGCGRSIPLEDLTITLMLGIDLDDENNLIISETSPVFNKETKKNVETYQVKARSIRGSRKNFDALATGEVTSSKIQVLLIGKRVLNHEGWFPILDTVYRNPTFSANTRIIVVDGPVSDVIFYVPEDKPQLPLHLKEVIDKNVTRSRTVIDTLQMFHRQMYEKGITPSLPVIKKGSNIEYIGVAMLNEKGKYVETLNIQQSSILLILKNEQNQELTFSLPIKAANSEDNIFHKDEISVDVNRVKSKLKTRYEQEHFHFSYDIHLTLTIIERLFPLDRIQGKKLEQLIENTLTSQFREVINNIQKHQIDPIGLGVHARAHYYDQFKKVEEHWGETLAESTIDLSINVDIRSMGAIN